MFTLSRQYKIHWELTDICNLKCPMCPRTNNLDRCTPIKEIQNTQFTLADVQRFFPGNFLKKVMRIDFCGNYGDPCMARDCYDICEFLIENHGIQVMISTNGSMKNPEWWRRLGELFAGTDSWIEFHIDGLRNTNHYYRIGANWDKIMENTRAFLATKAQANWNYIIFKHNQHQVDEAHALAAKIGFAHFIPINTGRFPRGGLFKYQRPHGDWRYLEEANRTTQPREREKSRPDWQEGGISVLQRGEPTRRQANREAPEIVCKAMIQNRFYLDSLGYIMPCCWVTNRNPESQNAMATALKMAGKNIEEFNIRSRDIESILLDSLFSRIFPELWQSDSLPTCRKKCGIRHRNVKMTRKIGNDAPDSFRTR